MDYDLPAAAGLRFQLVRSKREAGGSAVLVGPQESIVPPPGSPSPVLEESPVGHDLGITPDRTGNRTAVGHTAGENSLSPFFFTRPRDVSAKKANYPGNQPATQSRQHRE